MPVPAPAHKSSAWPLALTYGVLVLYASLYPFEGWRDQGIAPWEFLGAPWPRYWMGFDVLANVLGYAPLGFLLTLGALRKAQGQHPVLLSWGLATALSVVMEGLQTYLPTRVPSNVDALLNSLGAWLGATWAFGLERLGGLDRWSRFRARWFVPHARGALVLLALWPAALLFPAPLPLGLGQVLERGGAALAHGAAWLAPGWWTWAPVLRPLGPGQEGLGVALGALIPCLLGFSVIPGLNRRVLFVALALGAGVWVTALSAALSFGPAHAWSWLSPLAVLGLCGGGLGALLLLALPEAALLALLLLALCAQLYVLNWAPSGAYLAQTLQSWEQGRFIRFHGLAQWLGWLWPFATLGYALSRLVAWGRLLKSRA